MTGAVIFVYHGAIATDITEEGGGGAILNSPKPYISKLPKHSARTKQASFLHSFLIFYPYTQITLFP